MSSSLKYCFEDPSVNPLRSTSKSQQPFPGIFVKFTCTVKLKSADPGFRMAEFGTTTSEPKFVSQRNSRSGNVNGQLRSVTCAPRLEGPWPPGAVIGTLTLAGRCLFDVRTPTREGGMGKPEVRWTLLDRPLVAVRPPRRKA